jgi:hypothetical protein
MIMKRTLKILTSLMLSLLAALKADKCHFS